MTITPSSLTTGTTDALQNNWTTASVSPAHGSLVVLIASFYDSGNFYSGLQASGLGQTWNQLTTMGYGSSLGNVGAVYAVMDNPSSGGITFQPAGAQNHDACSWVVVEFAVSENETFQLMQSQGYGDGTPNRGTADTFTAPALAALGAKNLVIGYAGSYNSSTEALTYSNSSPWTVLAQSTGNAGVSKEIACACYYAIDTADTTVTSVVVAASDNHFLGAAEFCYVPFPRKVMMLQD